VRLFFRPVNRVPMLAREHWGLPRRLRLRHPALSPRDARLRVLVVVVGGIVLLHRDGLAGPKALYLLLGALAAAAAVPSLRVLREPQRSVERPLIVASAVFAALVILSAGVSLAHGTGVVAWMRDASVYGLLAAAPLLAIDLRQAAGPRWTTWLLVAAAAACTVSFAAYWLTLRGYAHLTALVLPSFYFPAALIAYATARALNTSGRESAAWWVAAGLVIGSIAATGTRTSVILLAAPLAELALPGRQRKLAAALGVTTVAAVLVTTIASTVGTRTSALQRLDSARAFVAHPGRDESWSERIRETHAALQTWRASPILGAGPGHVFHWKAFGDRPRSSFLIDTPAAYLAKFGVVGAIVLLGLACALALLIRERLRQRDECRVGAEALLGFSAVACFGFLLGVPLEDKGFPLAFLLLLALAQPGVRDFAVSTVTLHRRAVQLALTVAAVCIGGAVVGHSSTGSPVSSGPRVVVAVFENAEFRGEGRRACALLSLPLRRTYGTEKQCSSHFSAVLRFDASFIHSVVTAITPRSATVAHVKSRRTNGVRMLYELRRIRGEWKIASFRRY
jgi:hypothetical protein